MELSPKARRVTEAAERRLIGRTSDSAPLLNRSIHRNWEMFVIWSFVVVSFAVFLVAGYIIWVKCHSPRLDSAFPRRISTTQISQRERPK
jgi:hypothetical protein